MNVETRGFISLDRRSLENRRQGQEPLSLGSHNRRIAERRRPAGYDRRNGERRQLQAPLAPDMHDMREGERRRLPLELIQLNEAVWAVNIESFMPPDWQQQIHDVVDSHGKLVELPGGKVSTSLESPKFKTVYSVVKGPDIDLPWLRALYEGPLQDMVEKVAGKPIIVDPEPEFGININTITIPTQKDGYELHTDFNDWTALLAVTTMREGDGGELIHELPDGTRREIRIQAGWVYIFNGNIHAHKVNPLNPEGNSVIRITVPTDFFEAGSNKKRPSDLKAIFGNGNGNGHGGK